MWMWIFMHSFLGRKFKASTNSIVDLQAIGLWLQGYKYCMNKGGIMKYKAYKTSCISSQINTLACILLLYNIILKVTVLWLPFYNTIMLRYILLYKKLNGIWDNITSSLLYLSYLNMLKWITYGCLHINSRLRIRNSVAMLFISLLFPLPG